MKLKNAAVEPSEEASLKKVESIVRNVRFSPGQYRAIEAKAEALGMPFASFVRLCALKAAGIRATAEEQSRLEALSRG